LIDRDQAKEQSGYLIELFGGIGSVGHVHDLINGEGSTAFHNDINRNACNTLRKHFPSSTTIHGDIYNLSDKMLREFGLKQVLRMDKLEKHLKMQ